MQEQRDMKWDSLKTYLAVEATKVLGEPLLKDDDAYADLKKVSNLGHRGRSSMRSIGVKEAHR